MVSRHPLTLSSVNSPFRSRNSRVSRTNRSRYQKKYPIQKIYDLKISDYRSLAHRRYKLTIRIQENIHTYIIEIKKKEKQIRDKNHISKNKKQNLNSKFLLWLYLCHQDISKISCLYFILFFLFNFTNCSRHTTQFSDAITRESIRVVVPATCTVKIHQGFVYTVYRVPVSLSTWPFSPTRL